MGTEQGKTKLKTISALATAALVAALIVLPSCKKDEPSEEVISKRVRIGLQEEKTPPAEGQTPAPAEAPVGPADKAEAKPAAEPSKEEAAAKPVDTLKAPEEPKKAKVAEPKAEPVVDKKAEKKAAEPATEKPIKAEKAVSKEEKAKDAREAWREKVARAGKALAKKPYAVNVASFPSMKEANALLKSLKASGYTVYTTEFTKEGVKWYRVRVGFYKSREEAAKVGDKIESRYNIQSPWIVKPAKEEAVGHIK